MRPVFTAAAVAEALTAAERHADRVGWGALPALYALVAPSHRYHTVDAVCIPFDKSVWHEHQTAVESGVVPV
jgi:hypothetical protein